MMEDPNTESQAWSDLQSENKELKKKLKLLEEEKEKALEDVEEVRLEARDEINKLRREVETLRSENNRLQGG